MKEWEMPEAETKRWANDMAARFRVMARHLQQARVKKTKWVGDFGFIEEGMNDDDADDDDEAASATVDESQ
eukprot:8814458-Heterocapsa_arctica.AAC.1